MVFPNHESARWPANERGISVQRMEHSYREIAPAQTVNAPYRADDCPRLISNSFRLKKAIA
jgi:hypothetical protein